MIELEQKEVRRISKAKTNKLRANANKWFRFLKKRDKHKINYSATDEDWIPMIERERMLTEAYDIIFFLKTDRAA